MNNPFLLIIPAILILLAAVLFWQSRIKPISPESIFFVQRTEAIIVERGKNNDLILTWKEQVSPLKITLGYSPYPFKSIRTWDHIPEDRHLVISDPNPEKRPYFKFVNEQNDSIIVAERFLPVQKLRNFRDIGGYPTADGRRVVWGKVYRSGRLGRASESDLTYLENLGMKLVLDLRDDGEIDRHPDILPHNCRYEHIHIAEHELVGRSDVIFKRQHLLHHFTEAYKTSLVDRGAKGYGQVLKVLSEEENLPAVLHCTAGKDRTGVLAAIVLGILDVMDEDIIQDYTLSAPYMKEGINRWNSDPRMAEAIKNLPEYRLEASPESMALLLSTLKGEYGSVRGYVEAQGVKESLIHRLENTLLA